MYHLDNVTTDVWQIAEDFEVGDVQWHSEKLMLGDLTEANCLSKLKNAVDKGYHYTKIQILDYMKQNARTVLQTHKYSFVDVLGYDDAMDLLEQL